MSHQLARTVINRLNMQPAMLSVTHGDAAIEGLHYLAEADSREEERSAQESRVDLLAAFGYEAPGSDKPFAYADGIAFIPVSGLLINRFGCSWGWVTGYNFIRNQMNAALEDEDVKFIVYDVDSGGGEVAGCFELCDEIYASRAIKPSVAVVDSSCYSAAYAIGSSASRVIVAPSAGVGSIGVVAMHTSYKKMFDKVGIDVTFIYSGSHKVDGNPYEALPARVKADIQARVSKTREKFVALVARNRGLDPQAVFDTEAQCYGAEDGLMLGLVDAIAPPTGAVMGFIDEQSRSVTDDKENAMSGNAEQKPGAETSAASPENPAAPHAAPVASSAEQRNAERERIQGILNCEEAAERKELAEHLALQTDLSVEAARGILAAAPAKKAEPAAASPFTAAMDAGKHPNVGAESVVGERAEETAAERILKAQAAVTGVDLTK